AWVYFGSTVSHASLTDVVATSHHDNANDPSAGEKAALPGTSGTPGAANKFVTDADPRNTDARTPTSHDHSGETLNPAVVNVGDIGFKNGYRMTEDEKYGVVLNLIHIGGVSHRPNTNILSPFKCHLWLLLGMHQVNGYSTDILNSCLIDSYLIDYEY
ncbi:unnamed protein product, partial [marine sediment metagenome]